MQGTFVYLNHNSYDKDGRYHCYATFADGQGNILNFNAALVGGSLTWPKPFDICHLNFNVQQYGKNSSFILESVEVTSSLVDKADLKK